jgi:hypothetical protein
MLGIWRPSGKKLADMMNQVLSVRRKFDQCEVSLVEPSQVSYVVKLPKLLLLMLSRRKERAAPSAWKTLTLPKSMWLKVAHIASASHA